MRFLMIVFNFNQFLIDKAITIRELSKSTGVEESSISKMKDRGTIKPAILGIFQKQYGDCSKYISTESKGAA